MDSFSFNMFNKFATIGLSNALASYSGEKSLPIFICIGSDLVLGDSLGPLVGTFLKERNLGAYVYGTLNSPITAKEVEYAKIYLKQMHPASSIIAIDAAVGNVDDVGLIKVTDNGLKPGLGVDKDLGIIGDISIIGVVAGKSIKNHQLFNLTRLNLIFKMAEIIADGIEHYIKQIDDRQLFSKRTQKINYQ